MRVVVCPDKFRGSLSAAVATAAMAAGVRRVLGDGAHVVGLPLADGGEGTLDALVAAAGGSRRSVRVTGPLGDEVDAEYAILRDGTAVIEMARASGLALAAGRNDPLRASTRGTGELIAAVARGGCRRIVVGVGGSATTDGGLAALEALGWKLPKIDVIVACDVETRFLDAARVYGPQKGATDAQVALLSRRLESIAATLDERTGIDVRGLEHSGAAGGLAGGLAALGARLEPGLDVVADVVGLDDALEHADFVITGEGKLDATSLVGKVVGGVLDRADEWGVAWRAVICGDVDAEVRTTIESDATRVYPLVERVWNAGEAFARAELLCEEAAVEATRHALGRSD
jgi:glycerate 2-kinase